MQGNVTTAIIFTLLAGLSTGFGSAMGFFAKRTNTRFLAGSLGFSAGVMIYVSFVELLAGSIRDLGVALADPAAGRLYAVSAFFAGIFLIALIDWLVPEAENPHEAKTVEDMRSGAGEEADGHLLRMGTMTALAIGIHNFPEGLATFMSTLQDTSLGFSIAVAVAIHNIPEGIAVSAPIYYATGSRRSAFIWSFISGLAEPLGALMGYVALRHFMSPVVTGLILAGVAGIMVYISLDELLPAAEKYGEHHLSIYGAILGMLVMAASLLLLG
ncbi:MAG: zinc transporter ZupT [Planctomycetota bacterium]|jgi:ZIP family zinc transporter|nr:zinc transporter ZupT [Planctomycetota bacterium]